jgi:D-glycero-D-manno-heptose 1,7-bisphosphate phosphatase
VSTLRAAFVDRDGTINELVPDPVTGRPESPLDPEDVRLIPGAARGLRRLRDAGWRLIGVSNQPAAAKGMLSVQALMAVQARVIQLLDAESVPFDAFRLCLHHPDAAVAELKGDCACRKPRPGMLIDAAAEAGIDLAASWMIGDTDADVAAGAAAGCRTVLIVHPPSTHKRSGAARPQATVRDLAHAAELILTTQRVH